MSRQRNRRRSRRRHPRPLKTPSVNDICSGRRGAILLPTAPVQFNPASNAGLPRLLRAIARLPTGEAPQQLPQFIERYEKLLVTRHYAFANAWAKRQARRLQRYTTGGPDEPFDEADAEEI